MASHATDLNGVAGRYALALYDLANTSFKLDVAAGDLQRLANAIAVSSDLKQMLASPLISAAEKGKALAALLARMGADDLTTRFVGVIAKHGRAFRLEQIIKTYLALLADRRGEVSAEVSSALPLSDAQLAQVSDALHRQLGTKIILETKLDPSLIGGMVVRVGSKLIDNSLKTKLLRLQLAMKGVA